MIRSRTNGSLFVTDKNSINYNLLALNTGNGGFMDK